MYTTGTAAGLCARVRACAGAAESLHIYIHSRSSRHSSSSINFSSAVNFVGVLTLSHKLPVSIILSLPVRLLDRDECEWPAMPILLPTLELTPG